jgi:hypothetical protein
MYGRAGYKTPLSEIRVLFETVNPIPNSPPNFSAAPTQVLPRLYPRLRPSAVRICKVCT